MTTASYQSFFRYFGLRENPFHVSPDPRFYHCTPGHDSALHELLFGLQTRQGLLILTGEAGTGKTTLLTSIIESLAERRISTAYIFHSLLEPLELLEFVLHDFGVSHTANSKGDLLRAFHDWLIARNAAGDSPVLIVDEAQSLSLKALDELRLLLNLETRRGKLLQIILAGQSEFEEKLRRPELRQLRQRVMFHCKLPRLSEAQTASYIQYRLSCAGAAAAEIFPTDTLQSIHKHSKGIPRLVNLLCEHALITAYGEQQPVISAETVQRIAVDFDLAAKPICVEGEYSANNSRRIITFPLVESDSAALGFPDPESLETKPLLFQFSVDPQPASSPEPSAGAPLAVAERAAAEAAPVLEPLRTAEVLPPPEAHSFWRYSRSRFRIPAFFRRAAGFFLHYWRQVGRSFVHDCRGFFRSMALSTPELALSDGEKDKPSPQSMASWFREPMTSGRLPAEGETSPPAARK